MDIQDHQVGVPFNVALKNLIYRIMGLRVFIFTWNTQTVRYGVDNGPEPDFVRELANKIIASACDLVAIGLQEDATRDSPLLADEQSLMVAALGEQYQLLRLVSLSGWGVTTYKALVDEWDYRPRGLRLAIFKRSDLDLEIAEIETQEVICPGFQDWITAGKGGVLVNLHTNVGNIAFINIHLPFNSNSLINGRHDSVLWQAKCLRKLYLAVVQKNPDYLFLLGDLNFRVQIRTESGATEIAQKIFEQPDYIQELIKEADELRLLLDYSGSETVVVPDLIEGVNNQGPTFLPTCKLKQGRKDLRDCQVKGYKLGQEDQRTPSWCDRILFKQFKEGTELRCVLYDRWEYGTMNHSDHAAVIGVYHLSR